MFGANRLRGVIAAAITPLLSDGSLDVEGLAVYLRFLVKQGCHGALLLRTTGEGPSFSREEREQVLRAALSIRQEYPDFLLLAGTGTPSLEESVLLTKKAFSLGYDAVVVLPPYYFRAAGEEGLHRWFAQLFRRAVPKDGKVLLYHIPAVSGISLSISFVERLKEKYPTNFCGLKDSSGDEVFCRELGERFGKDLTVFTGKDNLLPLALRNHAAGSITAGANLFPALLRQAWDAYQQGDEPTFNHLAEVLQQAHLVIDQFPPASALVKGLLPRIFGFPYWQVRLPLLPLPEDLLDRACQILVQACASPIV